MKSGEAREGRAILLHEAPAVHVSIDINASARSAIIVSTDARGYLNESIQVSVSVSV